MTKFVPAHRILNIIDAIDGLFPQDSQDVVNKFEDNFLGRLMRTAIRRQPRLRELFQIGINV